MTKELEKRFAQVGSQDGVSDPVIIAHYFNPTGAGDWYATEFDADNRIIFGYVSIFHDWNDEWGYTSLEELEGYTGRWNLGIERDLHWTEKPASKAIPNCKGFGK
jgi:hypothetical protein